MKEVINRVMSLLWIKSLLKFMTKFYQITFRKKGIGFLQDLKYFQDSHTIKNTIKHL